MALHTLVGGGLRGSRGKLVTVVPQRGKGPGGWRAACIPLRLKRDTGEVFVCKFGVEMPIENGKGPISTPLAMRVWRTVPISLRKQPSAMRRQQRPSALHVKSSKPCTKLAPVSAVYGVQYEEAAGEPRRASAVFEPLPQEMRLPADIIARRLESTFGVVALPRDIADTPIPLIVQWKEPPETTLFHALFASQPERIP